MSTNDNNRLWKTIEYYERVKEYKKGKLDDIFRWLGIFVCSLKRSRVWKSRLMNEYKY